MSTKSPTRFNQWEELSQLSKKFSWLTVEWFPAEKHCNRAQIYISIDGCKSIWLKDAKDWRDDSSPLELLSAAFVLIKAIENNTEYRFVRDNGWKIFRGDELVASTLWYSDNVNEEVEIFRLVVEVFKRG